MRNFLNPEAPIMVFITTTAFSMYLGVLWLICCLPIVTVGASTTALFTVTLKMVKNEEGNVTAQFFKAFKSNFKQSTIVWLILLVLGVALGVDGYVLYRLRFENKFWTILTAAYMIVLVAYAIISMYIYPLMAHFENTIPAMFKNSIMIGMRYLVCTAVIAAIYFIMACIVINVLTPLIVFAEGICAYLSSYLLSNVFAACEGKKDEESEDTKA